MRGVGKRPKQGVTPLKGGAYRMKLAALILACAMVVSSSTETRADELTSSEFMNSARRMTSFSDWMKYSYKRVLRDGVPDMLFAVTARVEGEGIRGTEDNRLGDLEMSQQYYDIQMVLLGHQDAYSLGLVAAGMFNDVTTSGTNPESLFSIQDVAYLANGHIGNVRFRGGYLSSEVVDKQQSFGSSGSSLGSSSEWATAQLDLYGFSIGLRSPLTESFYVDHFSLDIYLFEALKSLTPLEEVLDNHMLPTLGLLTEYIRFPALMTANTAIRGHDDFLVGLSVQ